MFTAVLISLLANPIILDVPGLTCPTCVRPVQRALALTNGVDKVQVDWRTAKVKVTIRTGEVTRERLVEVLKDTGFPVSENSPPTHPGDYLAVQKLPPTVNDLAVWGKITVVAVCTPKCAPCTQIKGDLEVFASRVRDLAVRIVVVDGEGSEATNFLPNGSDVPWLYVYDTEKNRQYAGGNQQNQVYTAVETLLGVPTGR